MFWLGLNIKISPLPLRSGTHLTQCTIGLHTHRRWHLHLSNGLSRAHRCHRRQTDYATGKCVEIDEIACAARAIPFNNNIITGAVAQACINGDRLSQWR